MILFLFLLPVFWVATFSQPLRSGNFLLSRLYRYTQTGHKLKFPISQHCSSDRPSRFQSTTFCSSSSADFPSDKHINASKFHSGNEQSYYDTPSHPTHSSMYAGISYDDLQSFDNHKKLRKLRENLRENYIDSISLDLSARLLTWIRLLEVNNDIGWAHSDPKKFAHIIESKQRELLKDGFLLEEVITNNETDIQIVIVYHASTETLVITAPGTKSLKNLFLDLQLKPKMISAQDAAYFASDQGIFVPEGFYKAYVSVAEPSIQAVKSRLRKVKKIICLGHSLGGVLVSFFAKYFQDEVDGKIPVNLYTFGMPPVASIPILKQSESGESYHFMHNNDSIANGILLFIEFMNGYVHPGGKLVRLPSSHWFDISKHFLWHYKKTIKSLKAEQEDQIIKDEILTPDM